MFCLGASDISAGRLDEMKRSNQCHCVPWTPNGGTDRRETASRMDGTGRAGQPEGANQWFMTPASDPAISIGWWRQLCDLLRNLSFLAVLNVALLANELRCCDVMTCKLATLSA